MDKKKSVNTIHLGKPSSTTSCNKKRKNNFLFIKHLNDIYPLLQRSQWLRDELVDNCFICGTNFGMFNRKHHCRCCGKIFCYSCTNYQITIPELNLKSNHSNHSPEKVCSLCFFGLKDYHKNQLWYLIISQLPLEICDKLTLCLVSKSWSKAFHFNHFQACKQLKNTFMDDLSASEFNFIFLNQRLFSGHSQWLLQLAKACQLSPTSFCSKQIKRIFKSPQQPNINCQLLGCQEHCNHKLGSQDIILCLTLNNLPFELQKHLIGLLKNCSFHDLITYLPVFVSSLPQRNCNNLLIDFLVEIAKQHYIFANYLFWEISVQMENPIYYELLNCVRTHLTEQLDINIHENLKNSFYFVENLKELVKNPIKFPSLFKAYFDILNGSHIHYIVSPVNCQYQLVGTYEDEIKSKSSSSKPFIIPFKTKYSSNPYRLLFKSEDVRKDLIIMNLIKSVDNILKNEEALDLHITTYNILPTSCRDGFIEIVDNAETIYSINKNRKFSILNYILEQNSTSSIEELRQRFTKSCVAYCLLGYLLGIGDRHLENIMIKNTGEIFHIDFGFILGMDPKPLAPEIRITDEMVDAMGGYESKHYHYFKNTCAKAFLCLRRHVSVFKCFFYSFISLRPKIDEKFTDDYIKQFINNKFLVGEDIGDAKLYLINKISNRSNKYSESIIDFCHNASVSNQQLSNKLSEFNLSNWSKYIWY